MARTLANAWVSVSPSGFKEFSGKVKVGLKNALRGVSPEIPVTADTKKAVASVDSLKVKLKDFSRTVATARLDADDKQAVAKLAALSVKLTKLNAQVVNPKITLEGVAKVEAELLGVEASFDRVQRKADNGLSPSLSGLGSTLGHTSTGFLGLAAAGVALSPVIATLVVGFGGLGLAALGVSKNTALMGRVTAPLKKEFAGFTASLQPVVLDDFGKAAGIASGVLADLQPVAKATGTELGGLLTKIDDEFKSKQWQTFFQWMADNAGPDIQLVGDAFVSLLNVLPGLLMALQPIAVELIGLTTDFANLVGAVINFGKSSNAVSQSVGTNTGALGFLADAVANVTSFLHPGSVAAGAFNKAISGIPDSSGASSNSLKGLETQLRKAQEVMSAAKPSATDLAVDIRILGDSTAATTVQVAALSAAWDILVGNFASRATTILNAQAAVQAFGDAIKNSGAGSVAAKQAFESAVTAIGQITAADVASHAPASQVYQDILAQYNALKQKGPLNKQERDQLDAIRKFLDLTAQSTVGWTSGTKAAAAALENNFLPQLRLMHALTPKTKTDVENFTNSIINTGTKSTATHDARQKLINDLIAGGLSAKQAKAYVDSLQTSIDALHGKDIKIHMDGTGLFTITGPGIKASQGKGGSGNAAGGLAGGGFISGGIPGRDSVVARLMPGELVVPTKMVQQGAVDHLRGQLPGFASGGVVGGNLTPKFIAGTETSFERAMSGSMVRAMTTAIAAAEKAARARAAALNPFAGISGVPSGGKIGAGAAAAQAFAKSILWAYGWSQAQFPPLQALWNGESGWRWNALNPSSGAYGIPQALPASKMASAGSDWRTNAATQIRWGLGYIKNTPGYGSPSIVYSKWLARSPHWYGEGGMVPGMAAGGRTIAQQGQTFLNAWRSRHGGPYALAIGPKVINQQIPEMQAAIGRATTLSHAGGLSAGKHRFWANAAASEKRLLATLLKERTVERGWRGQLESTDVTLAKEIAAAGNLPSLRGNVRSWKSQMKAHEYTIAQISRMLGYSDSFLKAHPPAPKLPPIVHQFGGDAGGRIPAFLASVLSPFKLGGQVKSYDRGGWMPPGLSVSYNGTGKPERVGGGDTYNFTFENHGWIGDEQQMEAWFVRTANKTAQKGTLTDAVQRAGRTGRWKTGPG